MRNVRGLIAQGNQKLGQSICHFDVPAVATCPGASHLCQQVCYSLSGRYSFKYVKERLEWCYQQSLRKDFVPRVVAEIKRKGILVLRIHCSGDMYSAEYALKWLEIMRRCGKVRFYLYSRSWRIPAIAAVLEQMAALQCCRVWYSTDAETGIPKRIPHGVKLAYLQATENEEPEQFDLRFVVRKLKKHAVRLSLPLLCPHQSGVQENCGSCGSCFH